MMTSTICSAVAACAISLILTAVVRRIAPRIGLTDKPDGHRKLHKRPIPVGGGLAVFLATAGVLAALLAFPNPAGQRLRERMPELPAFFLAALVLVLVGLADDRFRIRGRHKLFGQLVAAWIAIVGGLVIQNFSLFGYDVTLGVWAIPVTLFWLLGAINAVNLLDGIDGLATTIGVILCATITAMAVLGGHAEVAIVAAVFGASLLGFLVFNFPPASIFLGDTGSMLIGLTVGALSIRGALKGPGTVLLAAPLAILMIPILDSAAAILRRTLTGRSIYSTDCAHLHHRLLARVGTSRKVLLCVGVFCAVTSLAALASVLLRSELVAVIVCLGLFMVLVATGIFGRTEVGLVLARVRRFGRAVIPAPSWLRNENGKSHGCFQGSRTWQLLWETFTESIDKLGLTETRLDIDATATSNGCHAVWESPHRDDHDQQPFWHLRFPLVANHHRIGCLRIAGQYRGDPVCESIQQLLDIIEPFEKELLVLVADASPAADKPRKADRPLSTAATATRD